MRACFQLDSQITEFLRRDLKKKINKIQDIQDILEAETERFEEFRANAEHETERQLSEQREKYEARILEIVEQLDNARGQMNSMQMFKVYIYVCIKGRRWRRLRQFPPTVYTYITRKCCALSSPLQNEKDQIIQEQSRLREENEELKRNHKDIVSLLEKKYLDQLTKQRRESEVQIEELKRKGETEFFDKMDKAVQLIYMENKE